MLTIETCCESVLIRISKDNFAKLLHRSHYRLLACDALFEQLFMFERKSSVFKGCASERYKSMVAFRPDIFRKISFKTIALLPRSLAIKPPPHKNNDTARADMNNLPKYLP